MTAPTPAEFFEAALKNALATVDLETEVSGVTLAGTERALVELGATAGISAAVDELMRNDLLDKGKWD